MTSSFSLKRCPYCNALNAPGTSAGYEHHAEQGLVNFFGHCTLCKGGVVGTASINYTSISPANLDTYLSRHIRNIDRMDSEAIGDIHWFPLSENSTMPAHLPKFVASVFLKARESMLATSQSEHASTHAFKRTIERSLRCVRPSWNGTILYKIQRLVNEKAIPNEMIQYAHALESLLLEEGSTKYMLITEQELHELQIFTDLLLQYLFTLPSSIPQSIKARW